MWILFWVEFLDCQHILVCFQFISESEMKKIDIFLFSYNFKVQMQFSYLIMPILSSLSSCILSTLSSPILVQTLVKSFGKNPSGFFSSTSCKVYPVAIFTDFFACSSVNVYFWHLSHVRVFLNL